MSDQRYLAHISPDGREQTVDDHLIGTAKLSERFAAAFQAEKHGYLAGIAHDIGKYSDSFQTRLAGGPKVDHSSAGAVECAAIGQELVAMCVAGHHGGLLDYGNVTTDMEGDHTFIGRIKKALPLKTLLHPGWNGILPKTPPQPDFQGDLFALSFWGRMLYSSLVDADYLDTEAFMKGSGRKTDFDDIPLLCEKLKTFTEKWSNPKSELNRLRCEILNNCLESACLDKGLFSLTVPTGGGKTISSLAFAINHAKEHGMSRIIYVIPYTSIIEQNAAVFREILGNRNVLEHHSEAVPEIGDDHNEWDSINISTENWDIPIIVTTAVQFFESLYANNPSKCRKLHNIANSVVIFDETQMIPAEHLLPCVAAIGTLVRFFEVSAVLCTATQPFISDILRTYAPGFPIRELNHNVNRSFSILKRVSFQIVGSVTTDYLAGSILNNTQVLCIVNSRKTAKELFDMLPSDESFHLSTLMTPKYRRDTLTLIRKRLIEGKPCRVVSTSLIEAGVDIDFPTVFREMSGLDSIVQAAGRCNREGKRESTNSKVFVFELENNIPPLLRINIGATKEALRVNNDPGDVKTIDCYFRSYRDLMRNNDKSRTVSHLKEGISGCILPYRTVAENFHLIDQVTKTVYIPNNENELLIREIRGGYANRETFREMGKHSVNIFENHFNLLYEAGDIDLTPYGSAILVNEKLYSEKTGLSLVAETGKAEFI